MIDNSIKYWTVYHNEGFFGFGTSENFHLGSVAHILPIVFLLIVIFIIYKYKKIFMNNTKIDHIITTSLTLFMIFTELSYWWRLIYVGPANESIHNMFGYLPIQACQWTLLITVCFMISRSRTLFGTSFFLTSVPSLLALLLPTVLKNTGPSYYRYYQYWLEHIIPIISVYYMMIVHGYKPKFKHSIYALGVLTILYFIGSKANALLDPSSTSRYLYMHYMRKIPFLASTNDLELYIVCLISFFIAFCIVYQIYKYISKRINEKNTMD